MNSTDVYMKTQRDLAAAAQTAWPADGRRVPAQDLTWVYDSRTHRFVGRILTGAAIFYWINYPRCSMS